MNRLLTEFALQTLCKELPLDVFVALAGCVGHAGKPGYPAAAAALGDALGALPLHTRIRIAALAQRVVATVPNNPKGIAQ